jgi:predicted  nucleic acid-binding Zn-ribbon protein
MTTDRDKETLHYLNRIAKANQHVVRTYEEGWVAAGAQARTNAINKQLLEQRIVAQRRMLALIGEETTQTIVSAEVYQQLLAAYGESIVQLETIVGLERTATEITEQRAAVQRSAAINMATQADAAGAGVGAALSGANAAALASNMDDVATTAEKAAKASNKFTRAWDKGYAPIKKAGSGINSLLGRMGSIGSIIKFSGAFLAANVALEGFSVAMNAISSARNGPDFDKWNKEAEEMINTLNDIKPSVSVDVTFEFSLDQEEMERQFQDRLLTLQGEAFKAEVDFTNGSLIDVSQKLSEVSAERLSYEEQIKQTIEGQAAELARLEHMKSSAEGVITNTPGLRQYGEWITGIKDVNRILEETKVGMENINEVSSERIEKLSNEEEILREQLVLIMQQIAYNNMLAAGIDPTKTVTEQLKEQMDALSSGIATYDGMLKQAVSTAEILQEVDFNNVFSTAEAEKSITDLAGMIAELSKTSPEQAAEGGRLLRALLAPVWHNISNDIRQQILPALQFDASVTFDSLSKDFPKEFAVLEQYMKDVAPRLGITFQDGFMRFAMPNPEKFKAIENFDLADLGAKGGLTFAEGLKNATNSIIKQWGPEQLISLSNSGAYDNLVKAQEKVHNRILELDKELASARESHNRKRLFEITAEISALSEQEREIKAIIDLFASLFMSKIPLSDELDKLTDQYKDATEEAKKLNNEIKTMKDLVSELRGIINDMNELEFGPTMAQDKIGDIWDSIIKEREQLQKNIDDINDSIKDTNKSIDNSLDKINDLNDDITDILFKIRDIRDEMQKIRDDNSSLAAEKGQLEFQLQIAEGVLGDEDEKRIRARLREIENEVEENNKKLADSEREISDANKDIADKNKEISSTYEEIAKYQAELVKLAEDLKKAQIALNESITGNSEQARKNRAHILELTKAWQDYILALQLSGASQDEINKAIQQAKSDVEKLGGTFRAAPSSVTPYIKALEGVKKAIEEIPKFVPITFKVTGLGGIDLALSWWKIGKDLGLYFKGGYTGKGNPNEPAGIVHKREYVVPEQYVDQRTGLPYADAWWKLAGIDRQTPSAAPAPARSKGEQLVRLPQDQMEELARQTATLVALDGRLIGRSLDDDNARDSSLGVY